MTSPSNRSSRSLARSLKSRLKRRKHRQGLPLVSERLEQRAMMAIFTAGGGPVSSYAIIASDLATDVYVRQTIDNDLQVANNSSFIGDPIPRDPNYELESVPAADILYVTNGRPGTGPGPMYRGDNTGSNYQADAVPSTTTFFSLSNGNLSLPRFDLNVFGNRIPLNPLHPNPFPSEEFQVSRAIQGELRYNNATWQFEVGPTGQMFFREAQRLIGNVSNGSQVVTGLRSTAGLEVGMTIIGRGIPADATIAAILGPNSVRMNLPATRTINSGTLDFAPLTPSAVQPVAGASSISLGEVDRSGRGEGLRGTLTIQWTDPVATVPDPRATPPGLPDPPVIAFFSYTYDNVALEDGGASPWTDINLVPSSTPIPTYRYDLFSAQFRGEILGGVIPGTVSGSIIFDDDVLSGNAATAANKGLGSLSFSTDFTTGGTLYFNRGALPYGELDWLRVTGTVNDGVINLQFTNRYATDSAPTGTVSVNPGTVRVGSVNFLRYVQDPNPNSFTVFAGFDLTSQLQVDYRTTDSTVNIESTINVATPGTANVADLVLGVTNVNVKSQVISRDTISMAAETVYIDAAMAAPGSFNFQIANDPFNDPNGGPKKGRLQLSPSGSLTGAISPTFGLATTPTGAVVVHATQADVYAEGIVYGLEQEWLMRSTQAKTSTDLAPYVLSTRSPSTGVDTGLLRGNAVSIVLGNDAPTPIDDSIAYNTLDLNTQVDSLRIKASTRQQTGAVPPNPSASGPFPYNLSIRETDDISLDAVAASGMPISLEAGGSIRFTSALATANDLTIRAAAPDGDAARLTISAPVSTTRGQIRLVGDSVAINNALIVSDAASDDQRDDIYITATKGDISLAGLVSARNRVKLEQRSPLTGVVTETPYASRGQVSIPDNSTVTDSIVVADDFVFSDLDVEVDITHTFVGDLTGTLIAPDGRRIRLFSRNGGSGDNFTDTIFDSEAVDANGLPRPISSGAAPFTGRFRPLDSLAPLYGTSALGTWRLEVKDEASGDVGTLDSFTLRFQTTSLVPADRRIFGAGRIVADRLDIDAQGAVGNPSLLPTDTNFYLRTDVNTLAGRTGASMSIDELNDINIVDLRAPGFVSLRANGVDPASGRNAGNAALKANLIDITGLDVASPNGSVDVLFDTAKTIELGNGKGLQQGRFLNSTAAGDVTVRSSAGSIVVLDAPVAGGNARRVRVGTSAVLAGSVYTAGTPGVFPSTLRGTGDLSAALGITGSPLRIGERVLVKNQANAEENGVYRLTAQSTANWGVGTTWTLTRALDSDTAAELPNNTFVRVSEGAAVGVWQLGVSYATPSDLGTAPITVTSRTPKTDIGSDDPNDLVTFVVTTTGSTNSSAGSLGKMISLRQENTATTGGAALQPQKMEFRFSNAIATTQTPIQLTQELPEILSAFTIDGAARYASSLPVTGQPSQPIIDGSRITMNRQGRAIADGDVIDGFRVRGAAAAGASIANVIVGGFSRGAAIEVRNAPGVLVNKVILGVNERGDRLANRVGVRFIGGAVTSGGVVDSQVFSSSEAGIAVEAAGAFATGVKVVGTTIGRAGLENALGVRMASGVNQLGVDPVEPTRALPQVAMTRLSPTSFTIPSTYTGITAADVGMPLFGTGVTPSDAGIPATIASVAMNTARRLITITITGGEVTGNSLVTFGNVVFTRRPAIDERGNVISGRDITLPASVNMANVFLGQTVTGDGIGPGSVITAINGRTLTLSKDMTKNGFAAITLVAGRRNVIQANRTGVVLAAGATTVANTSIINNNFNGLEITGTGGAGAPTGSHHVIGTSRVRSATSNAIHGNGGWGVFIAPTVTDDQKANQIRIQGNYLGTNASTVVPAATFSNKKGNIGHKPGANEEVFRGPSVGGRLKFVPDTVGVDTQENQHGIYTATGGGGTGGGGGVVPNNPATRRR